MDPQEELEWRTRIEGKVDKLFGIVTDIRITCAQNNCDPGGAELIEVQDNRDMSGREKFLLALLGLALTTIGLISGIAFG